MKLRERLPFIALALVWLVNGLWAKVFGAVPRHEEIVGRILGEAWARELTVVIGGGEVVLALAILFAGRLKLLGWLQIGLVATMNVLERVIASDLLLWGTWNAVFAALFCVFVAWCYRLVLFDR